MSKFIWFAGFVFGLNVIFAQGFTGSLEFRYAKDKDTSTNVYHVKGNKVKLDQYSRKNQGHVEGSFLFDLNAGEIKFINPKRKLWGMQKNQTPQVITGECVVTKGRNTKTIAGYRCGEYIVKNTEEDLIITYWITQEKFNFFIPLIKLWNRPDKQSIYFGQIRNLPQGSMPMMSEEKQLSTGKSLSKLEITKVEKTNLPDATFSVPADYAKFDQ